MGSLKIALLEKTGHDHGFEHVLSATRKPSASPLPDTPPASRLRALRMTGTRPISRRRQPLYRESWPVVFLSGHRSITIF